MNQLVAPIDAYVCSRQMRLVNLSCPQVKVLPERVKHTTCHI